jgi:hypothetical protein
MRSLNIQPSQPIALRSASVQQVGLSATKNLRAAWSKRPARTQRSAVGSPAAQPEIQPHILTTLPGITAPNKLVAGSTAPAGDFLSGLAVYAFFGLVLAYMVDGNYLLFGFSEPFMGPAQNARLRRIDEQLGRYGVHG